MSYPTSTKPSSLGLCIYLHDDLCIPLTCLSIEGAMASARMFDLKIIQKSGQEHNFTLIAQEEHEGIKTLLKAKKVCMKNNMADGNTIMTVPEDSDDEMQSVTSRLVNPIFHFA